jgi:hypothetical protein
MSFENVQSKKGHVPGDSETSEPYFVGKAGTHDGGYGSTSGPPTGQRLLNRLEEWRAQAKSAQSENRAEMALDEDYADGIQWTPEERYELEVVRGQPALTFDLITPTIAWVTGTEKRSRVDYKVLPRRKEFGAAAEQKTAMLKADSDVNRAPFHISASFRDAVVAGLGWLEEGVRSDTDEEPLFLRGESWRNIWYDPLSRAFDLSDCRYLFREKFVDLDFALAMFPKFESALRARANTLSLTQQDPDEFYDNPYLYDPSGSPRGKIRTAPEESWNVHGRRERVCLVEFWYREPATVQVIRGDGAWDGTVLNPDDPLQQWLVDNGHVSTHDAVRTVVKQAIFVPGTILQDGIQNPYWHNQYPFTPVWGYRRKRDGGCYGMVRKLRDPQDDFNKKRSKTAHILATKRTIMEKGAVDDIDAYAEEVARPDAIIEVVQGKTLKIETDHQLAGQLTNLAAEDVRLINSISGVTPELRGEGGSSQSGKAVLAKQDQGQATTMDMFDNLRLALQISGEKRLRNLEQFTTDDTAVRILGAKGGASFVDVQAQNVWGNKADFIIDEQAFRASARQAMFEAMMELLSRLDPKIAVNLLDLVVDLSDVPQRDELVSRIRKINGQSDPDKETSEEELAAEQEQAKIAAAKKERMEAAQITLLEGRALKEHADAALRQVQATAKRVEALFAAMNTAQTAVQVPGVTPVADAIARSAGFEDQDAGEIYPEGVTAQSVPDAAQIEANTSPNVPASPQRGALEGIETGDTFV